MRRFWLIAALALLVPVIATWSQSLRQHPLHRPSTPLDIIQPVYADYWRFLQSARRVVSDGSSYTIRARNADEETTLFMLSQGLFDGVTPYPATFLWTSQPGGGAAAEYVLVYGSSECPAGIVAARPVAGGTICKREWR